MVLILSCSSTQHAKNKVHELQKKMNGNVYIFLYEQKKLQKDESSVAGPTLPTSSGAETSAGPIP
jgi:hypothetical protein